MQLNQKEFLFQFGLNMMIWYCSFTQTIFIDLASI